MFKQNDILVDKQGNERKVLGVCGELVAVSSYGIAIALWFLEKTLINEGWTLKQEKCKPESGSVYFFLDSYGMLHSTIWIDNNTDLYRLSTGNCHRTEQDAVDYKVRLMNWASENK